MVNKDLSAVTEILIFKIMNGLRKCYLPEGILFYKDFSLPKRVM